MPSNVLPPRTKVRLRVANVFRASAWSLVLYSLGAGAVAAAETPEREHVLFVGMDVFLALNGVSLPVVQADNSSVQILREGERLRLPLRGLRNFKTPVEPKISSLSLRVDDFKTVRVFHGPNDPARDAMSQQSAIDAMQENALQQAESGMRTAAEQNNAQMNLEQSGMVVPPEIMNQLKNDNEARMRLASESVNDAYGGLINGNGADIGSELADASNHAGRDALEVSFMLSSPRPISGAYAVLRTFSRAPGSVRSPGVSLRFFGLPKLEAKPRRITLLEVGLPPGFEVERCEIHIYANGRELATNLSNNRMTLSEAEMVQFLVTQHIARNAGASVPIQLVPELVPDEFATLVPADQRTRLVEIATNASGGVESVVLAPRTSNEVDHDAAITAAVRRAHFLPALLKGKAVAGNGTFALSEFLRDASVN